MLEIQMKFRNCHCSQAPSEIFFLQSKSYLKTVSRKNRISVSQNVFRCAWSPPKDFNEFLIYRTGYSAKHRKYFAIVFENNGYLTTRFFTRRIFRRIFHLAIAIGRVSEITVSSSDP